ncbi:MAG: stage II sporulation protein P [Clostridia bacterium]|nr:stage II sporulation protein P [Clostridia bacterium]
MKKIGGAKTKIALFFKLFVVYALMPLAALSFALLLWITGGGDFYRLECLALEYSADSLAARIAGGSVPASAEPNDESGAYSYQFPDAADGGLPSEIEERLETLPFAPEGMKPIVKADLSSDSDFINTTSFSLDASALREAAELSPADSDAPLVLVLHTHGTEAYYDGAYSYCSDPDGKASGWYDPDASSPRSEDRSKNVVGIGDEFCRVLEENGVPTVHCDKLHDKPDFNSSYPNSYASAVGYLEKYPSIRYVIDIHRDSVVRANGDKIATDASACGDCAQVMLVAGTDESGYYHPDWRVNLGCALLWKDTMDSLYPSLSRPIYVRTVRFNQHVSHGAMLLEIGSCGNTFEEAKTAARCAAQSLAALIRSAE